LIDDAPRLSADGLDGHGGGIPADLADGYGVAARAHAAAAAPSPNGVDRSHHLGL
jgi:hypothetical protein